MKRLYVYADFDWLKEVELIGELGYESLRGADSYSFTFNNEWLRQHSDLFLSDDLNNYPGQQSTSPTIRQSIRKTSEYILVRLCVLLSWVIIQVVTQKQIAVLP